MKRTGWASGLVALGLAISGGRAYGAPGSQGPGSQGPGNQGPGSQGPGSQGPGSQGPGSQGPGSQGPGTQGPGSQGPGTQGPGSQGPGSQGPGTQGPGTQGPGSQGPGNQGPGLQSAGSYSHGTQAIFPASETALWVGNTNAQGVWEASQWQASSSWLQFITGREYDANNVLIAKPAWTNLRGVITQYDRYRVVNGRLVFENEVCVSGTCSWVVQKSGTEVNGSYLRAYLLSNTSWITVNLRVYATTDYGTTTIPANAPGNPSGAWSTNDGPTDQLRYRLELYAAQTDTPAAYKWFKLCAADQDLDEGYGILHSGTFVHYSGDFNQDGMSYSCDGGTAAKAMRVFGYQPWETYGISTAQIGNGKTFGQLAWIAATRALMGDYCENNRGLTRLGTWIDLFDNYRINQPYDGRASNAEYAFAYESTWVSTQDADLSALDNTETTDRTCDFVQKPGSTMCPQAGSLGYLEGAKGDLAGLSGMRYQQMQNYSWCQHAQNASYLTVPSPTYANISNPDYTLANPTAGVAAVYIKTSTMCDHSMLAIGAPMAADCNACTQRMAQDAQWAYCTTTAWDFSCGYVASGLLKLSDNTTCPTVSNYANNTIQFQLGEGMGRTGADASIKTNKRLYSSGEDVVITWNNWTPAAGTDKLTISGPLNGTISSVSGVSATLSGTNATSFYPSGNYEIAYQRVLPSGSYTKMMTQFVEIIKPVSGLAVTPGHKSASLSWNADPYARIFRVDANCGGVTASSGTLTTTTSYSFTNLPAATLCTFSVYSGSDYNQSAFGAIPTTITATTSLTAPVINATNSVSQNTQVTLVWAPVFSATSYRVYVNNLLTATVTSPTAALTGLTNGTNYNFSVSAVAADATQGPSSATHVRAPGLGTARVTTATTVSCTANTATCGNVRDASLTTAWAATSLASTLVDLGSTYAAANKSVNRIDLQVSCTASTSIYLYVSSDGTNFVNALANGSASATCSTTSTSLALSANKLGARYVKVVSPTSATMNLFNVQVYTN